MEYVIAFLLGTVISWVSLLIIIPIAQKIAEFSFPPWSEALWKLAVVAAAGSLISVLLDPINWILSAVVGAIVFFALLYKWFDIDVFGAVIIVFVSWMFNIFVGGLLIAAVMGAIG